MLKDGFNAVLPSFLMMFIGFLYGKIFNKSDADIVNKIATWLMAPVITFTFINDYTPNANILLKFTGGFALMFAVSYFVSGFHKSHREIFFTGNVYVNSGYLGYPVLMALWGEKALALGVVYSFVNVLFGSTFLPSMIRGSLELKNALKLPFLYAILIGWVLGVLGISYKQMPYGVLAGFNWIRDMAIPFLLLQVGISISRIKFDWSDIKDYLLLSFERLVLVPAVMLIFTFFLNPFEAKVFILECAMPIGVNSVVVINTFKKEDTSKAGVTVAITTLFSLITLPLWAVILEKIFK
ncbi:MAG: AEC family transporter [Fervidobacterium sp.]|nr:AEC family transporter [Fervidobacterium sp.]